MSPSDRKFVSRGGEKLDLALDAFGLDVAGLVCADLGCNVGGFTDCLLQRGARQVYAVDTGYGALAWTLRQDDRVVVMERTNALHCEPAAEADLVTIDVAWTPQRLIVPAAMAWLARGGTIVSLLKPHYELAHAGRRGKRAPLTPEQTRDVCLDVTEQLNQAGASVTAMVRSGLKGKGGNEEFLLLIRPK